MLRALLILLSLWSSLSFAFGSQPTQIHEIDPGKKPDDEVLVLLTSGVVARIGQKDTTLLEKLKDAHKKGHWLDIRMNQNQFITGLTVLPQPEEEHSAAGEQVGSKSYWATVLPSMEEATFIYKKMNPHYRADSQCFHRAHVWAYEAFKSFNLKSKKIFIFFTKKYIREFKFKWWFHVSPYTLVKESNKNIIKVMDYRYTYSPISVKEWTDIFMENKVACQTVSKYSQYSQHQESAYCYLMRESMYYYQPRDFANKEAGTRFKTGWVKQEVNIAYKRGFKTAAEIAGTTTGGVTTAE